MAYTVTNFKTKKAVKEAITKGEKVKCYQPGLGPDLNKSSGLVYLEGPHYPKPHTWHGQGILKDGILVNIK